MEPKHLSFTLALLFCSVQIAIAQLPGMDGSKVEWDSTKNIKWAVLPIPTWDQFTGFGLGAVGMGYYKTNKKDTISPTSSFGVIGFASENDDRFIGAWNAMYVKEDLWRVIVAGGAGNYNFQFMDRIFSPPTFVKFRTDFVFGYASASYNVWDRIYVGGHFVHYTSDTNFDVEQPVNERSSLNAPGLNLVYDSRDNINFPIEGFYVLFTTNHYLKQLNTPEIGYDNWELDINNYQLMGNERDVIALRAMTSFNTGDVPFEAQEVVGDTDIPGYFKGRYRGNVKIAFQSEYRWNFAEKWGAVGLLAAASIGESVNKLGQLLPAAGGGIRYLFMPSERSRVGLDFVKGKDDWQMVIRFGESF